MKIQDYKNATEKLNEFTGYSKIKRGVNHETFIQALIDFTITFQQAYINLQNAARPKPKLREAGIPVSNSEDLRRVFEERGESVMDKRVVKNREELDKYFREIREKVRDKPFKVKN